MFNQKQYIQVSVVSVHTTSNGTTSVAGLMKIYGVFEDTHFNFTKRQSDLLGETQSLQYQMASHYALFLVVGRTNLFLKGFLWKLGTTRLKFKKEFSFTAFLKMTVIIWTINN